MIYLIDDKKTRQEKDYSWTIERFNKYDAFIRPIYTLEELQDKNKEVFQEGNVILYHESFLDKTFIKDEATERQLRKVASPPILIADVASRRPLTLTSCPKAVERTTENLPPTKESVDTVSESLRTADKSAVIEPLVSK